MAGNASTGNSITDSLTRAHRMTLDEARLILNLKNATEAEKETLLKVCIPDFVFVSLVADIFHCRTTTLYSPQTLPLPPKAKLEAAAVASTFNPRSFVHANG